MRAEISLGSMRASVRVNPGLDSLCPIEMLLLLPPHLSIEPLSLSLCPSPAPPPPPPRARYLSPSRRQVASQGEEDRSVHRGIHRGKRRKEPGDRNNSKIVIFANKTILFCRRGRK